MNTTQRIILPANIYDALELSALANKGVGSGCLKQEEFNGKKTGTQTFERPVCIIGHGLFLDGNTTWGVPEDEEPGPVVSALAKAFGFERIDYTAVFSANDEPVCDYLEKKYDGDTRRNVVRVAGAGEVCSLHVERKVTWRKWCELVGVVRGDD